jgi:hypothetical protein
LEQSNIPSSPPENSAREKKFSKGSPQGVLVGLPTMKAWKAFRATERVSGFSSSKDSLSKTGRTGGRSPKEEHWEDEGGEGEE